MISKNLWIVPTILVLTFFVYSTSIPKDNDEWVVIDLSILDNVDEILDYYIDDSKLYIYTKTDSINDEHERYEYIKSIENSWEND
tara:strand:- start:985 stop:1239 length:255 start_codon:yes stop_codon:yes gene_type:complete